MRFTSISRLVMTPVLLALVILVALNAASIYKSFALLTNFDTLDRTLMQAERDANVALSTFKTQVQEWKNVLLRGSNTADREKYWARFQQREAEITSIMQQLQQNPHISGTASEHVQKFLAAHALMADKYRQGYDAFVASGFNAAAGDDFVRGIDRAPASLLSQIAGDIAGQSQLAFSDLRQGTAQTLWLILIAAVVLSVACTTGVIMILRREVITPVKHIARALTALAANRYDEPLTYHSQHELGTLAEAARSLQHKLQNTVAMLQGAEQQMNHAAGTMGEVSQAIQYGADEQSASSQSLSTSTTQLGDIVQNLVAITDQVAAATSTSQQHVATCYTTFETANKGFHELAATVSRSAETVNQLQARSANILRVVNVINEIADQTNLLALNAAIEAARAGEHGRGFAVVADEVRALAAKTQQSTQQINDILSSFEAESRQAVEVMEAGRSLADTNAQEASTALSLLNEVVDNIRDTASVVEALNAAADEQEAVLRDVEGVIARVVESSQRYHELSQRNDISAAMKNMSGDMEKLVVSLSH